MGRAQSGISPETLTVRSPVLPAHAPRRGKRSAMQNSRIMLNQPKAGAQGDTFEVSIAIAEANRQFQTQANLLHQYTDLPVETCEELLDRETYLSAEEAKEYNIIDRIL